MLRSSPIAEVLNVTWLVCARRDARCLRRVAGRDDKISGPDSRRCAPLFEFHAGLGGLGETSVAGFRQFGCSGLAERVSLWCGGGQRGWHAANWLWIIRGWLDRLVGGPGLRRGRRDPEASATARRLTSGASSAWSQTVASRYEPK